MKLGWVEATDRSGPACRCASVSSYHHHHHYIKATMTTGAYLGENVVREKEYLSAILFLYSQIFLLVVLRVGLRRALAL